METSTQHKAALILIDYINEIVDEKGKLAGKGYAAFVARRDTFAKINRAIERARAQGIPVLFVRVGFSPDYHELPLTSPLFGSAKKFGALQLGTWATEIHRAIQREPTARVITKHRVSAFYQTDLEEILKKEHVDTLLIAGVATDLAVQSMAREAHDRDYRVFVLEDICAAATEQDHNEAIRLLAKIATIAESTTVAELQ